MLRTETDDPQYNGPGELGVTRSLGVSGARLDLSNAANLAGLGSLGSLITKVPYAVTHRSVIKLFKSGIYLPVDY